MTEILARTLAAGIGTVAFSLLFGVPRRYEAYCGVIGAAGWFVYELLSAAAGLTVTEATFFATVLVVLLSRFAAVQEKCPATVFQITGIFPLVPGAGIYWTSYYLVEGQQSEAIHSGFMALKAVIAIVLGIIVVSELPYGLFRIAAPKKK